MASSIRRLRPRTKGLLVGGAAAIVLGMSAGIVAGPQSASAYPSWSEVQAAKGNADATKAEVQTITSSLDSLRQAAAARGQAAIDALAASQKAQVEFDAASATAAALDAQYAAQQKKAALAHREAGQLAARLYRFGADSTLSSQLFDSNDSDDTLYKLGALSQLTTQWQTVLDHATVSSKAVAALGSQAAVAAHQRDLLATKASSTLAAAQSSQQAANTAVADATTQQQTLYAQLATLNNTSVQLEQQYQQGQIAQADIRAEQAAQEAAKNKPRPSSPPPASGGSSGTAGGSGSGSGSGSSSGSGSGSGGYVPPAGVVDDPAGARAYAQSVLPSHGWDSGQYQCLVLLWTQESGWRTSALNPYSTAYGIPQALPAQKMSVMGVDWQTNYRTQINWGLAYIAGAYGSPCAAWNHEIQHNWY